MPRKIEDIVKDFARGLERADRRRPQAVNVRTKKPFQPGIGPHTEARTIALVGDELITMHPEKYEGVLAYGVPYPEQTRQKCDLCIKNRDSIEWAIEVKMLRILGDNGKANDNILMHILSPYSSHRSALTDCKKLGTSSLGKFQGILIYGYDANDWPLDPAIEAFEVLAKTHVRLGVRHTARVNDLIHPVHSTGAVFGWEILK